MKFILVLLVLLPSVFLAQIPVKSGWNIGVDAGTAYNHMTTKELSLNRGHWGITAGVTGSYTFRNNVMLESGLRFTDKGSDRLTGFDPQQTPFLASMTLNKLNYLEIPFMVGYKIRLSNRVSITPKVGAYYGIGVSGWGFIENGFNTFGGRIFPFEDNPITLGDGSQYTFGSYENLDGGFLFGMDLNIWQMTCRIAYGMSLEPVFNSYDSSNKHRTLSISVGYYLFKR